MPKARRWPTVWDQDHEHHRHRYRTAWTPGRGLHGLAGNDVLGLNGIGMSEELDTTTHPHRLRADGRSNHVRQHRQHHDIYVQQPCDYAQHPQLHRSATYGDYPPNWKTPPARNIEGSLMTDYKVVVDKSTVPVGTADMVHAAIAEELRQAWRRTPLAAVSNLEFLKEGLLSRDFKWPDRIVVGASEERAIFLMRSLWCAIPTAATTSEFDRHRPARRRSDQSYAANAMLAKRIVCMNEPANWLNSSGPTSRIRAAGNRCRSANWLPLPLAGSGYGGSTCFPKNGEALIKLPPHATRPASTCRSWAPSKRPTMPADPRRRATRSRSTSATTRSAASVTPAGTGLQARY